jgi:uncharacterized protein (DUF427 family)
MAKAVWNGQTLAESEKVETVEGVVYFPDESMNREFFRASSTTSSSTWGQARYYTLVVDGQENPDAAWYYPDPKPAARSVKHHVAFWRGVDIKLRGRLLVSGEGPAICRAFLCLIAA